MKYITIHINCDKECKIMHFIDKIESPEKYFSNASENILNNIYHMGVIDIYLK